MKEVVHPHDALFKFVLSMLDSAKDLIELLPEEFTELLDLDTSQKTRILTSPRN